MTTTRTVDYEYGDLGLEVTSIHEYLPRTTEMDQLLSRNVETNSRICAYMYLKDDKPKIEILDELQLDKNVSILCLRQHISCYRPKLIRKIIDKYCQDEKHKSHIIIMDFRLVHFDSLSVKREIKTILANKGMEFAYLSGILVSTPKQPHSDLLDNDPDYVFINNTYCKSQHHDILKELGNYSMATTSDWITTNPMIIKKPSHLRTVIESPCFDCPERDEIQRRGLPTSE